MTGALGAPPLALIGALALACFVKVFGAMFLGEPRSHRTDTAHESSRWLLVPMAILGGLCALIGLAPWLVTPLLDRAIVAWAPELASSGGRLTTLAPLAWISFVAISLTVILALAALLFQRHVRKRRIERPGTWDCGYVAPGPTMQYSSSSFAQTLVGIFSWALRPKVSNPNTRGVFAHKGAFTSHVDDPVLDSVLIPAAEFGSRAAKRLRWLQRGSMQAYLLYIILAVIVLLLWR